MSQRGIGRIDRRLNNRIASRLAPTLVRRLALMLCSSKIPCAAAVEDDYFSLRCRKDLFFKIPLQGRAAFGQTPGRTITRKRKMADVNVPQRLDPQDIVKLLVALRKALKASVA